jgi:5-methylcytosine-specific restriction endonuclease McrA
MKQYGLIKQMKRERRMRRDHLVPHCGICGRAFDTLAEVFDHQDETNHLLWLC